MLSASNGGQNEQYCNSAQSGHDILCLRLPRIDVSIGEGHTRYITNVLDSVILLVEFNLIVTQVSM